MIKFIGRALLGLALALTATAALAQANPLRNANGVPYSALLGCDGLTPVSVGNPVCSSVSSANLTSLDTKTVAPFAITATATITRPADTVTYAVNDAWSNSTSAPTVGGYTLAGVCPAAGRVAAIISLAIMSSADPATSLQGEVWIFDSAVTAINDNAAFALSDADAVKLVGVVPFTLATSQGGSGTNAVYTASGLNIAYTCVGTGDLRYVVKVKNAYVPTSAEALTVRANVVGLN